MAQRRRLGRYAILIIVVLGAAVAWLVYQGERSSGASTEVEYLTGSVTRGSLVDTIDTLFVLQTIPTTSLNSVVGGVVTAVHLEAGTMVTAGFTPLTDVAGITVWGMTSSTPLYRDLLYGIEGADVIALQEALVAAGYDPGEIDGRFRYGTEYALEQWQADHGMVVSGVLTLGSVLELEEGLTVDRVLVEVGTVLTAGGPIADLVEPGVPHPVSADVSQFDVLRLESGQPVVLTFDAAPDQTVSGTLESLPAPVSSDTTGTEAGTTGGSLVRFPISIVVASLPDNILPGMTGTASLVVASRENVLIVPVAAIGGTAEAPTVQVLVASGIEERAVVVGLITTTSAEIITGLAEGEEVVVGISDPTATATTLAGSEQDGGSGGPPPGIGGPPG